MTTGSATTTTEGTKKRWRAKWTILAVMVLSGSGLGYSLFVDDALRVHEDLRGRALPTVLATENGFFHIRDAASKLPEDSGIELWDFSFESFFADPGAYDIDGFLGATAECLPHLEKAAECQWQWQTPPLQVWKFRSDFKAVLQVLSILALSQALDGDLDQALRGFDMILSILSAAERGSSNSREFYAVSEIRDDLVRDLEQLVLWSRDLSREHVWFIEASSRCGPSREILVQCIRASMGIATDFFEKFDSLPPEELEIYTYEIPCARYPKSVVFKKNRTINMFAELLRECARSVEENRPPRELFTWPESWVGEIPVYLSGNALGLGLLAIESGSEDRERFLMSETRFDATRLLMAIRMFFNENGELPATLAELCPDYIDSVPRDPWGDGVLKYSRAKRFVYSVGEDGVDRGGMYIHDDASEPTFHLSFRE